MSVMKRVRDITYATWNEHQDGKTDPLQVMDRMISELRQQHAEWEQAAKQAEQHAKQLERQAEQAAGWAAKRQQQAELAVRAGEEVVARMALADKKQQAEQAERYAELYRAATVTRDEAWAGLLEAERQLREAEEEKRWLLDRLKTASMQQQLAKAAAEGAAMWRSAFSHMEHRIRDMEWQAEGWQAVRSGTGVVGSQGTVARAASQDPRLFSQEVEDALAQLKQSQTPVAPVPPAASAASPGPQEDKEEVNAHERQKTNTQRDGS